MHSDSHNRKQGITIAVPAIRSVLTDLGLFNRLFRKIFAKMVCFLPKKSVSLVIWSVFPISPHDILYRSIIHEWIDLKIDCSMFLGSFAGFFNYWVLFTGN